MQIVLGLVRCEQEKKRDIPPEIIDTLQNFVDQSKQIVQPVEGSTDALEILEYFQSGEVRDKLVDLEEVRSNILANMSFVRIEFYLSEIASKISTLQADSIMLSEEVPTYLDELIDEIAILEDRVQYLRKYREMRKPWDGSFVQTSD